MARLATLPRLFVRLTNFGTVFPELFRSVEEAVAFAKLKGFEAGIFCEATGTLVASWSVIGGTRRYA